MKTIQFVFVLFACITTRLWSATCPAGRPSIYFGNGVNTNQQDALNEAYDLQQAVLSKLATSQSVDPACLDFKLSYDSKFLDSNNLLVQLYNLELQVAISSGAQVLQQFLSQAWQWFADLNSAPIWFKQTIANVLQSNTILFQPDLQAQVLNYNGDITAGNKVIVVAHSQGNLYANQAYAALLSPPPSQFSLISVATPANNVIGQPGPYVTLINDIITLVLGSLPGNISNFPGPNDPCGSNVNLVTRLACHAFDSSYLAGINSGPAIVSNTISALPIVLGVSKLGPGKGTITSAPSGINCDLSCTSMQATFKNGATVTLTETTDSGSKFMGWSGDCAALASGGITDQPTITFPVFFDASGTVITSYPENCTATYGLASVLTVTKSGTGTGTVTSVPAGINCGSTCMAPFPASPPVQLTATAAAGSIVTAWGGDCASAGTNSTALVTVNANKTCDAKFDLGGILTVTKSGTGTGTVSSVPAGINCGPTCMAPFPASSPVQLTATAAAGSTFTAWSGDCAGMAATTMISVTANKTCTATFGGSLPAVRLNPFGPQTGAGPYNVEVVDHNLMLTPAPQDITVTLLRDVISQCSGLLFSSNRTVVVSQGQSTASYNFNAGHDPACNTLPITTRYTVTQAVLGTNTVLDLSGVPAQQLVLAVTR